MDNGLAKENKTDQKMGATSNPNLAKLAQLQQRRKNIEEKLASRNEELRQLCVKEAELTGVMPIEYPLEPGETPPSFRRRIGTSFQLSQNLINNFNNNEKDISEMELEKQVLTKLAEAALGLANEHTGNKTIRRKHMAEYQLHKQKLNALEEKLAFLKPRHQMAQIPKDQSLKPKKKPRPTEQDDALSVNMDVFGPNDLRKSSRSLGHNSGDEIHRYSVPGSSRLPYSSGSDSASLNENVSFMRNDVIQPSMFYHLTLNGYKSYEENRLDGYSERQIHQQYANASNHVYKPQPLQYITTSQTLPHPATRSSHSYINQYQEYHKLNNNRQLSTNSLQASPSTSDETTLRNPHQLQPHQQYDHTSFGLGGYWKRSENGEQFWCNSLSSEASTLNNKKFGSLDRRKNKRMNRISPNDIDVKPATIASVPAHIEPTRVATPKAQQIVNRRSQDSRQLIRTQSLGSVGVQTADVVCPSDDNSSCTSETYNDHAYIIRKHKKKEWYETELDGPENTTAAVPSRSHSTVPSLAPEEKCDYASPILSQHTLHNHNAPQASLQTPKAILEIPAESNPPIRVPEANLEIFNNNIPRNATVVQPAQWRPYHEETKPFEMSDFYKYSTKYNKSPQKSPEKVTLSRTQSTGFRNLPSPHTNEMYEDDNASAGHKPRQQMKCQLFSPVSNTSLGSPVSLNSTSDLTNIAENFSAEMNAWYQKEKEQHKSDNNNATLV